MLPFNEIDLAFLNSTCGLQISFCTGVARRVALRELLADVMVPFVESRIQRPAHWEDLKTRCNIVDNFRTNDLEQWFENLTREQRDSVIQIVRSMLEVLKDTGIDKNGEELVIAWVRKEVRIQVSAYVAKRQAYGHASSPTQKTAQPLHASPRCVSKMTNINAAALKLSPGTMSATCWTQQSAHSFPTVNQQPSQQHSRHSTCNTKSVTGLGNRAQI